MKTCMYEPCSNEATGKSAFCCKSHRAQHSRRNKSSATSEAQQAIDSMSVTGTIEQSIDRNQAKDAHMLDCAKAAVEPQARRDRRTNPDSLNYGEYMNSDQLKQAGLSANRVPIPGDSDYQGCCELVDGQWRVKQCA